MWDFLTAREPGEGYFGGAEGALRFVALVLTVVIFSCIYYIFH